MTARRREQLPLFGRPVPTPVGPATQPDAIVRLAAALPREIRLGTSSWSFPGWAGLVWDAETDVRTLARHGLAAYAQHPLLRTVGIDRTYYAPLPAGEFRAMAAVVPADFRFLVKAAERSTVAVFGDHARYGRWRGRPNPYFLDPAFASDQVVGPFVQGLAERAGPLVFQFPPQSRAALGEPAAFADRLAAFLRALPAGPIYAVEIRNRALCTPAFAAALRDAGALPCLTVHPAMPPLAEQATRLADALTGPLVVRWMLGHGRPYEAARERYAPFDRLVDEDPATRSAIARLALDAARRGQPAWITINNKAEGSAPASVVALAAELARLGAA